MTVAAERRLGRLEGAADARTSVRRWLDEAHRAGSLAGHARSLMGKALADWPYAAIPEQARRHARESTKGQPAEVIRVAEDRAVSDALFLLELVMVVEERTAELVTVLGLRVTALHWEHRARTAEGCDDAGTASWRDGVADVLATVARMDAARALLEAHYLDGHPVLFPETVGAWGLLRDRIEQLVLADPRIEARAIERIADSEAPGEARGLMVLVRARAHQALGDLDRAASDIEQALRSEDAA